MLIEVWTERSSGICVSYDGDGSELRWGTFFFCQSTYRLQYSEEYRNEYSDGDPCIRPEIDRNIFMGVPSKHRPRLIPPQNTFPGRPFLCFIALPIRSKCVAFGGCRGCPETLVNPMPLWFLLPPPFLLVPLPPSGSCGWFVALPRISPFGALRAHDSLWASLSVPCRVACHESRIVDPAEMCFMGVPSSFPSGIPRRASRPTFPRGLSQSGGCPF